MIFNNKELKENSDGVIPVNFCTMGYFMKMDAEIDIWMNSINKGFLPIYIKNKVDHYPHCKNIDEEILFKVKKLEIGYNLFCQYGCYLKGELEFYNDKSREIVSQYNKEFTGIKFVPLFYTYPSGSIQFVSFQMYLESEE